MMLYEAAGERAAGDIQRGQLVDQYLWRSRRSAATDEEFTDFEDSEARRVV